MPGIEASMLLMGEGQTPPNPAVGGAIVEGALKLGRPSMVLISDIELRGMVFSPNLTALDKRIGQDTIAYMLDLRAKGGPAGRRVYFERGLEAAAEQVLDRIAIQHLRRDEDAALYQFGAETVNVSAATRGVKLLELPTDR
jgi:hypothetical protein